MAVAIASLASLASCDIDSSPNGKLDGYWKMASIDSIESGNILNLDNELYFWIIHKLDWLESNYDYLIFESEDDVKEAIEQIDEEVRNNVGEFEEIVRRSKSNA